MSRRRGVIRPPKQSCGSMPRGMPQPPPPAARGADAARPDEDNVTMTVWCQAP